MYWSSLHLPTQPAGVITSQIHLYQATTESKMKSEETHQLIKIGIKTGSPGRVGLSMSLDILRMAFPNQRKTNFLQGGFRKREEPVVRYNLPADLCKLTPRCTKMAPKYSG